MGEDKKTWEFWAKMSKRRIEVYVRVHTEGGVEQAYYHNCKQIGFSKMTQADVNKRLKKKKWQDIWFFSIYYLK